MRDNTQPMDAVVGELCARCNEPLALCYCPDTDNADVYNLPEDAPELHDEALDDGRWDDDPSPYDGTYSEE